MSRPIATRLALFLTVTVSCTSSAPHRAASLARIPVQVQGGIVFVPTTINGKGPFWFELDSGFQNCAIDRALVSTLGLSVGERQNINAPGGSVERATVMGAELSVAGRVVENAAISALDLSPFGPFFGRAPDGILGYDFFRSNVIEVDYEQHTLTLFDVASFQRPDHAISLPIDTVLRQPYVAATVVTRDGRRVTGRFEIDTGSMDALNLNTPFAVASNIPLVGADVLAARGRSIGGETQAVLIRVVALEMSGLTVSAPIASVVEDAVDRAGQISAETLRRFTVTFDYSRNVLHLVRNATFGTSFDLDMAGWFIIAAGANLDGRKVFLVLDGSPAAEAGVTQGDVLLRVDGRPVASYTLDQLRALFKVPSKTYHVELMRGEQTLVAKITTRRLL
ncbi:MAG TPA: aspartyl protease family protein [Gemmatimonadaceae bacterium]